MIEHSNSTTTEGELRYPVGQAVFSSSVSGTRRVTAKRHDLKILFDTTIILLLSTPEGTVFLHS